MYENANFSIETEKETITELHQLDMEFCTIAMWIPSLRDVISRHLYSFIYKGSASNKEQSGMTHFVVGHRIIQNGNIVLTSIERGADPEQKAKAKPQIEVLLTICAMCLRSIEEELQNGGNPISSYAEVGNRLKHLNLHQSVRTELYKHTELISNAVQKIHRKAQAFSRKNIPFPTSSKVHILLNGDPSGTERANTDYDISDESLEQLRQELFQGCAEELSALADATGVESTTELMKHWSILYSVRSKFEKIKRSRNKFVVTNTGLIKKEIHKVLRHSFRVNERHIVEQKAELCFAQTVTSLLEKVYKYIPDNRFTTFAVPYIKQECKNVLINDDVIKLPPVYAGKQAEVLNAGLEIRDGKEVFNEDAALKAMRTKYSSLPWDSQIIADVRFKQSTNSTISIHENDDEDDRQSLSDRLSCHNSDPEKEVGDNQWAEKIVDLISTLPQVQRSRVCNQLDIPVSQIGKMTKRSANSSCEDDKQLLSLLLNFNDK